MSEDRLLQSFCALLGAIVLVASVHIFLLATSAPRLELEPEVRTALLPEAAPDIVATDAGTRLIPARVDAEPVSPADTGLVATDAGAELAATAEPDRAPAFESPDLSPPALAEAEAASASDSTQDLDAAIEPAPTEAEMEAAALLEAAATDHAFVSEPAEHDFAATADVAEAMPAETPIAEAVLVEDGPSSYAASPSSLEELIAETIGASEETPVALAAASELDEAASPPAPATVPSYDADPSTTGTIDALPEITVPLRKPQPPIAAREPVKVAEKPAPEQQREQPERRQVAAARADSDREANAKKLGWKPMTLGFAKDKERRRAAEPPKPTKETKEPAPAKARPLAKPVSSGAYRAQVWAKLARHRPRLGKPGSTTVVFAIGPSGALRAARVGRSSGNAALDQRALAAVRAAAPFPAPPGGLSASALNFSIQIYFR